MVLLIIPFLIYSFFSFQKHLLNRQRAKSVKLDLATIQDNMDLMSETQLLLAFLPAPTLKLQLFHPSGTKAGELETYLLPGIVGLCQQFLNDGRKNNIAYMTIMIFPLEFF